MRSVFRLCCLFVTSGFTAPTLGDSNTSHLSPFRVFGVGTRGDGNKVSARGAIAEAIWQDETADSGTSRFLAISLIEIAYHPIVSERVMSR